MQNIRIDLRAVADLDPMKMGRLATLPSRIAVPPNLKEPMTRSLNAYSSSPGRPGAPILADLLSPTSRKPRIDFLGALRKAVFPPSKDVTVGIGPGFSVASAVVVGASAGVYGWYKTSPSSSPGPTSCDPAG